MEGLASIDHLLAILLTFFLLGPNQWTSAAVPRRWRLLILAALADLTDAGPHSSESHAQGRLIDLVEEPLAALLFLRRAITDFVVVFCLCSFTCGKLKATLI